MTTTTKAATLKEFQMTVLHVKRDLEAKNGRSMLSEIGWGEEAINYTKNHDPVAEVSVEAADEAGALDQAYRLTQNIDQPWTQNSGAAIMPLVEGARSTHIGDVIVFKDTQAAFVCAPIGWKLITSNLQKLVRG